MRTTKKKESTIIAGYELLTMEERLRNVPELFAKAKAARTVQEDEWRRYNDYYNFIHEASGEMKEFCEMSGIPWSPAVCPDPWIMVESQIDPNVPYPEFRGRDTDMDSVKAKQREYAVRYMLEANDIDHKNTANERRVLKLGDAFWKAYWSIERRCGIHEGDIAIDDVSPEAIFPDPAEKTGEIQNCMYVAYVYTMHKVKFWQTYKKRLRDMHLNADEVSGSSYVPIESVFDLTTAVDDIADTVQVLEFWFKWPDDGECVMPDGKKVRVNAGDVACSVQAGNVELQMIPNYWKKTGKQCKLFPFIHYWRIRDENSFWNKSELYPIMDLVDAEDRKLGYTLLNDAFMANDILTVEEDALADGQELTNAPGATIYLKQGRSGAVQRLGGLSTIGSDVGMLNYLKEQIERTNRNYETNLGKETSRQTTATGLAMLREDSSSQADIKKADRKSGFERLYQLLDWLALEFYDDNRMIYLGADEDKGRKEPVALKFNSSNFAEEIGEVLDAMTGEPVREAWTYYPKVDVTVTAGDSIVKGKQATLQALGELTQANITEDNWKLYAAQLNILDIPDRNEIIEGWRQKFEAPAMQQTVMPMMQPEAAPMMQQEAMGGQVPVM